MLGDSFHGSTGREKADKLSGLASAQSAHAVPVPAGLQAGGRPLDEGRGGKGRDDPEPPSSRQAELGNTVCQGRREGLLLGQEC